ncbi:tyrosyl-tRNA synthetase [Chytridiales sp. JEL 0842]|nr:tyrosyl-tRNA synthetase [Chytridiales sp. JEL 0842]
MLEFVGDVGRFARVSIMLARDSVKNRLDTPEGISFTEFTYQLLQAYDFYHLNKHHSCTIQIGGSDQWGNITAGIDLIRKKNAIAVTLSSSTDSKSTKPNHPAYGLTIPLVTTSNGEKFGKSAGNAIWLNPSLCTPFDFYQFFRRTPDASVRQYLHFFTFLSLSKIESLMHKHSQTPSMHLPQRTLAAEVTELVHGPAVSKRCATQSQFLFDANTEGFEAPEAREVLKAFEGDERLVEVRRGEFLGRHVGEVAVRVGAVKSKNAGRKLLASGGFYLNNQKLGPDGVVLGESDIKEGVLCLMRTGKSNYKVLKIVD